MLFKILYKVNPQYSVSFNSVYVNLFEYVLAESQIYAFQYHI
jgi:hypothetical protein